MTVRRRATGGAAIAKSGTALVSTIAGAGMGCGSVAFQTPANINVEAIAVTAIKERSMTPLYGRTG